MHQAPRISLIFPPFCESAFHGPHLAIPVLRGILESQRIPTRAIDLNIRTVRHIVSEPFLFHLRKEAYSSDISENDKLRIIASIDHLNSIGLSDFLNSGTVQLKSLLKFAKALLFPHPTDLDECLTRWFDRPTICEDIYQEYIEDILLDTPNIVGLTVAFSDQLSEAIELARRLRLLSSDVEVWLGGSQINLLSDSQIAACEASQHFDRISTGNGEQTILQMIDDFCQSQRRPTVYRSQPMDVLLINRIPPPVFDDIDEFFEPVSLPVLATKGCYWGKCTFCDYPKLSNLGGKPYIARDPALALSDIRRIQDRFGELPINLISDAVPPSWYRKLCELAVTAGIRINTWSYMMHSKALTADLLGLMANAGVLTINFGTESTIDRVLGVMKKQAGYSIIKQNLVHAQAAGIRTVTNVIPDYPTITITEAHLNARRFEQLLPFISSINPQMFDLTAGTPIEDNPRAFDLDVPSTAYIKTSHGFHSRPFKRKDSLSASDRKIVEQTFARLKWRKKIARRKEALPDPQHLDNVVAIDGSAILLNGDEPQLWIMSLGTSWNVSVGEARALGWAMLRPRRMVTYRELLEVARAEIGSQQAESWVLSLADTGLLLSVSQGQVVKEGEVKWQERAIH